MTHDTHRPTHVALCLSLWAALAGPAWTQQAPDESPAPPQAAAPAAADPAPPPGESSATPGAMPAAAPSVADTPAPGTPSDPTLITGCGASLVLDNPDPHPASRCQSLGDVKPEPAPQLISICRTNDHFGASFAAGGDFDGDGRPDIAIGGMHRSTRGQGHSQVWVLPGDGGRALLVLEGDGRADLFGYALAFVPDLDGDGRDELLVGAPEQGLMGRLYLLPGQADQAGGRLPARRGAALVLEGIEPGGRLGAALCVGDLDGDGRLDLAVGAPGGERSDPRGYAGAVHVFPDLMGLIEGRNETLVHSARQAAWTWRGESSGARFGAALAVVPQDAGVPLLAVGAPATRGGGADSLTSDAVGSVEAFRLSLDAAVWSVTSPPGSGLGYALDAGGDLNGDGQADLLVGAPLWSSAEQPAGSRPSASEGAIMVLSGADGAPLLGDPSADPLLGSGRLGAAVRWLPDVTGDLRPDLLVGAPLDSTDTLDCTRHGQFHDQGGSIAGSAWVLDGVDGSPVLQIVGEMQRDRLGWALAAHDLDGDGLPELLTGGLGWSPPAGDPSRSWLREVGRAYVVNGSRIPRD
ncbi:MAG: hypothetical protein DRQ55_11825 [Planctomycetota bacterium]|nr:MAG: hypothetical protein DRQ55_11825 [Planctomycetota bacterium]